MKKFVIGFVPAAAAVVLAGCGGGGSTGEVIAKFNGDEITKDQYLKQLETMDTIMVTLQNGQQVQARPTQSLSTQALSKMVERNVVLEAAKTANVLPSQEEIDREKVLRTEINPQFQDQLRAAGYSGEDIDLALKVDLSLYKLTVRGQQEKTLDDAQKYVKDNSDQFKQPETATLRWIVVNDAAVRAQADKMLVNASFGAVAARYSIVPTAKQDNGAFNSGGQSVPRPVPITNQLGEELLPQVKKIKEGGTGEWFRFQNTWAKVKVEAKTPAIQLTPKPAQLEMIRRDLSRQDARGANGIQDMLLQTLLKAEVNVMPAYLKKNWETMLSALKSRTMGLGDKPAEVGASKPGAGESKPKEE